MIEISTTRADEVILVSCAGTVTLDEFENVVNAEFERIVSSRREIDFVLHLGDDFLGFGPGAWGDVTESFLRTRFNRGAVVTDNSQLSASVNLLKWILHGSLRTFHNDELERALGWTAA